MNRNPPATTTTATSASSNPVVGIDAGGTVFYSFRSTLTNQSTYLATLLQKEPTSTDQNGRSIYFVDMDPQLFNDVLIFLREGILVWPQENTVLRLRLRRAADSLGIGSMVNAIKAKVEIPGNANENGILEFLEAKHCAAEDENLDSGVLQEETPLPAIRPAAFAQVPPPPQPATPVQTSPSTVPRRIPMDPNAHFITKKRAPSATKDSPIKKRKTEWASMGSVALRLVDLGKMRGWPETQMPILCNLHNRAIGQDMIDHNEVNKLETVARAFEKVVTASEKAWLQEQVGSGAVPTGEQYDSLRKYFAQLDKRMLYLSAYVAQRRLRANPQLSYSAIAQRLTSLDRCWYESVPSQRPVRGVGEGNIREGENFVEFLMRMYPSSGIEVWETTGSTQV